MMKNKLPQSFDEWKRVYLPNQYKKDQEIERDRNQLTCFHSFEPSAIGKKCKICKLEIMSL